MGSDSAAGGAGGSKCWGHTVGDLSIPAQECDTSSSGKEQWKTPDSSEGTRLELCFRISLVGKTNVVGGRD